MMEQMKIAIQGARGSFHDIVARDWFGPDIELVECEWFDDVFAALQSRTADRAVCAVENSLYGSINDVYDLLIKHRVAMVGEVPSHIHQQLIGLTDAHVSDVTCIYSHPVALNQCREFLDAHLPEAQRIEHHDTADAVRLVAERGDPTNMAIASHLAAELHGLKIHRQDIEDEALNYTRFLILDPNASPVADANKASLILQTDHSPGSLYRALGVFAQLGLNMTKLYSRPIRGKLWRYQFFVDLETDELRLEKAIRLLERDNCEVTVLGHYKAHTSENTLS